jgi:hypothetical protein
VTKAKCFELADSLGVEINDLGDCIEASTPDEKVFIATGNHSLVLDISYAGRSGVWRAMFKDLTQGLEDCNAENCEDYDTH